MFGPRATQTDGRSIKRRDGRGLGPFTSGHLTMIIVTLVIVIGFPFAAFAVTGSNVFVTDATSGTNAKVDTGGHVLVGDGKGPLTIDGTVNDRAALPTKPIVIQPQDVSPGGTTIYGPVSKPFALGNYTVANVCGSVEHFDLYAVQTPGGAFLIQYDSVPPNETANIAFPVPLVSTPPAGGTVSLTAYDAVTDGCLYISGAGYQS